MIIAVANITDDIDWDLIYANNFNLLIDQLINSINCILIFEYKCL